MPNTNRVLFGALGLVLFIHILGCAPAPFSMQRPGLTALDEEVPYFYDEPGRVKAALATPQHPQLKDRVLNLFATYEEELQRAEKAQGGAVNHLLNVSALVLPVAGLVSALALSDPDDVEAVSIATSSATAAILGINTIFKPQAKADRASRCEAFLRGALESIGRRWDRNNLDLLQGTEEEWQVYLSVRSGLELGKQCACE